MSDMPAMAPMEGDQPLPMGGPEGELPDLPEGAASSEGLGEFEDPLPITLTEEEAQTLLDDGEVVVPVSLDEGHIEVRLVVGEGADEEAIAGEPDDLGEPNLEGAADVGPVDGVDDPGAVLG